jgi:hypothetical protein
MPAPLTVSSILDMAFLGRKIAEGERSPEEFFEHWPDISTEEEKDVKELWFQVQYFENDIVYAADSAEFYRAQILKFVGLLEDRYKVKWERKEEG